MMTIEEMKIKVASNYQAWKSKIELEQNGYDEETAIALVYRIWFNEEV